MAPDIKKRLEQSKNSDELPIGGQPPLDSDDEERPSRSGMHELDADRRRSREPYSGVERRAR